MSTETSSLNLLDHGRDFMPTSLLEIFDFPETGRGLKCCYPVSAGSVLLAIPKKFLMTPTLAVSHIYSCECHQETSSPKFASEEHITLFLCHEASIAEKSTWFSYLQSLPHFDEDSLLYLSEEEVKCLPEFLTVRLKEMMKKVCDEFQKWEQFLEMSSQSHCVKSNEYVLWEKFLRYWLCVNSRCVYCDLKDSSAQSNVVLIPFLDMLNHSFHAKVETAYDTSLEKFVLTTNIAYPKDSQVFINYGPHDNLYLLLEYGFCIKGNPQDCVMLSIEDICKIGCWSLDEVTQSLEILSVPVETCSAYVFKEFNLSVDGPSYYLTLLLALCSNAIQTHRDIFSYDEDCLQGKTYILYRSLVCYCKNRLQSFIHCVSSSDCSKRIMKSVLILLNSWLNICSHLLKNMEK